jgi:hypothetical protein
LMIFACKCVWEKDGLGGVSVGANIYFVRQITKRRKEDSL